MIGSYSRRGFALAALAAIPLATVATLPLPSASATTVASIACTGLTGGAPSHAVVYSGCSGNTGGSSHPVKWLPEKGGTDTITWANKLKTTVHFNRFVVVSANTGCPGESEVQAKGTVTADTTGSTAVGQKVHYLFCLSSTGTVALVPGTKAII